MSTINSGDYPIDPYVVDGVELANRLNRLYGVIFTNNLNATRPSNVAQGGLWSQMDGAEVKVWVFDGVSDQPIGGGSGQMYGDADVKAISYNAQTINENITVLAGHNGLSAGPITVENGFAVTVESGSVWTIV
jgi:hypothetical protein